jgi:1,4-dihydroxy-2-naphthoate octaprenyltransferase
VKTAAYGTLLAAAAIGCYFCLVTGWFIFALMVTGAVVIRFYTSHLSKWLIGELASGLTLGTFVVWGVHFSLTASLPADIMFISIPPGLLTALLLLLNEFPDVEADRKGGRNHLLTRFGKKKGALIYTSGLAVVYGMILAAPFLFNVPYTILISLLTIPLAVSAARIALKYPEDHAKMVSALGMNVGVVILGDLLLASGYFFG